MDPISLALGGASLLGGLLGGSKVNKATAHTGNLYKSADEYLNYAKEQFGDPNSAYYNAIRNNQNRTIFDMLMSSNRMNQENLAGQGIRGTGKLASMFLKNAQAKAGEQAGNVATQLYGQGMGYVSDAYRTRVGAYGQGANIESQVSMFNAGAANQASGDIFSGLAEFGAGLIGQQFAPGLTTTPTQPQTYGSGRGVFNNWMNASGAGGYSGYNPFKGNKANIGGQYKGPKYDPYGNPIG